MYESARAKSLVRTIQRANKYALSKKYQCLYPQCAKTASRCHSIQRAACVEALAKDGHVYTLAPTFTSVIGRKSLVESMQVVRVGVNEAGTFYGFCGQHDYELFDRAETIRYSKKRGMFISLHFRSVALELCRKRRTADFLEKAAELVDDPESADLFSAHAAFYRACVGLCRDLYLDSLFGLIFGQTDDAIEWYCLPFVRNLQVSCCGMFSVTESIDSAIGFNLISYSDFTTLLLTTFGAASEYLDRVLAAYPIPQSARQLVNDVAFRFCEEPLIAPALWERLNDDQRFSIRMNLRPPDERFVEVESDIIGVGPEDIVHPSPSHLKKLYDRIYFKPGEIDFH